jgi:organic hydroperoxide reductase OsmC/OhrA
MSKHEATVKWKRQTESFAYPDYNRDHVWKFGKSLELKASAAPEFLGSPGRVDPEEAFVASVSSCHMLTFLAICARKRIIINAYRDHAVGYLEKNESGQLAVSKVELFPAIEFEAARPDDQALAKLHHQSHEQCSIANSIRTTVEVMQLA